MTFSPLHLKSEYSLGLGTDSIADLVAGAAQRGYSALALTDLENLYGQLRLHHECRSRGLKALTGLELRPGFDGRREFGSRAGRVVLLAADLSGYGNLCRLVSLRRTASAGEGGAAAVGADPVPQVLRHAAGLFALSDDPRVVERLFSAGFPRERIGLLLPRPDGAAADLERREAAARLGVRLVADLDAVFLEPSGHALHLLQVAVRQGRLLRQVKGAPGTEDGERWLRPAEAAAALFADQPEALAAAAEIAEACNFSFETLTPGAPAVGFAEASAPERLRELCRWSVSALFPKGRGWTPEHGRRLQAELALFEQMNLTEFVLVVAQILEHCRTEGIPTAVRGSAVSSLVLHLLGGSPVDPLREGLIFERFLHPGKSSWPDVDIDLPWQRRDEVIEWVFRHFGRDRVAMVAAHHTFQLRSALREGLKACGVAPAAIEALTRALPPEDLAGAGAGGSDEAHLRDSHEVDFLGLSTSEASGTGSGRLESVAQRSGLQAAVALVRRLVGRPRHVAVHPGGIVVGGESLAKLLPLELSQKGVLITQYDLVAVARLGLIKIDLLGNRCLSELAEVLGLGGYPEPGRLDALPAEDPATLALIDRADTMGCFQLESPAMRALLARLPIRRQSDLTAALALIRPGAAAGDVKAEFIRLARGEVPELQPFPALAKRLRETHGLFLYEEDIMELLSLTGGLTLGEADEMRREIVQSGGDANLLAGLRSRFLEGAARVAPRKRALAQRAWALAARFAAYSFNKAHAASYARLAYYSAYTKVHHPVQFAAALLNHHQGMYPLRTEAAALQRLGVELRPPRVNRSDLACGCQYPAGGGSPFVQVGLDRIKVLSQRAVRMILASREAQGPFHSLRDLLDRVRLNARELEALVLSGACDELAPLSPADYPFAHEAALELVQRGGARTRLDTLPVPRPVDQGSQQVLRYQGLVRVKNELRFLEMHLSAHPAALLRGDAQRLGCRTVAEALAAADGESLRLMVLIAALRRVPTAQGPLEFLSFEDETGMLEAVLLPTRYRRFNPSVTTPGPFLVEGRLRREHEAVHLEVLEMAPFHERPR